MYDNLHLRPTPLVLAGIFTSPQTSTPYNPCLGYHEGVTPLDLRLGLTKPLPLTGAGRPLRWGILACGKVAHDFTQALKMVAPLGHAVVAVAARSSASRAEAFAAKHGVPKAYGSYEALAADSQVDIVYVASLHPDHLRDCELALNSGKHVLVEKPIAMSPEDATAIYALGRERGLFVGEGMWTRFFPAVEVAREALRSTAEGALGPCKVVTADFCIDGRDVGPYPSDSIYQTSLGGGAVTVLSPYLLQAAALAFNKASPDAIAALGKRAGDATCGELAGGAVLTYSPSRVDQDQDGGKGGGEGGIAVLVSAFTAETPETAVFACSDGRLILHPPAHCPTSVTLQAKVAGRGERAVSASSTAHFPLPLESEAVIKAGGFLMPNSMGFVYEAAAVGRCIAAGLLTFPQWTEEESVETIRASVDIQRAVARGAVAAQPPSFEASIGGNATLRHVVSLRFKDEAAATGFDAALRALPAVLEAAGVRGISVEGGANVSREGKGKGFTHTFVVSLSAASKESASALLEAYTVHPAHAALGADFGGSIEDVAVMDFWK